MQKKYIIAIDEGSSSVKASLFDIKQNKIILSRKEPLERFFPKPLWVEQNAEEIFLKAKLCLDDILSSIDPTQVAGIGITNQRETTVLWNKKTGKPIHMAISWQCRRTSDQIKKLDKQTSDYIFKTTGLIPDAYFSATKIKWILKNNQTAKELLKENNLCAGTIDSFLIYRLTNKKSFVSDITNASRTMLLNIHSAKWDEKLLNIFSIPEKILPQIALNDEIVGYYDFERVKIPIAGVCGDQQSSLFGQTCFCEGDIKITFGTGCFLLLNTGSKLVYSKHNLVSTIALKLKDKPICYALEGSVFNCGTAVNWLKTTGIANSPSDCDKLAQEVKDSNGAYFVPAFTGLGSPYWQPQAKGILCGLLLNTNKNHITRAVLEGIAYSSCDVFKVLEKDYKNINSKIKVDGGVSRSKVCMQFLSDLIQKQISKSEEIEQTSMGAIYLCGLATGVYKNLNEIKKLYKVEKTYSPKIDKKQANSLYKNWQNVVKKTY